MLRYLLLRFLPRRLVPLLFLLEILRLVRRWQTRNDPVTVPSSRARIGTDANGAPRYLADGTTTSPNRVRTMALTGRITVRD